MRNTSNKLLNDDKGYPEVEVLLATFNGEQFLGEFLHSLLEQKGVRIHLRISDDGSTDKTLKIVDLYRHVFESYQVFKGPRKGPASNFISLIRNATYQFVALADQDDVWLPDHLINSINRLSKTPDLPSLTFSAVTEFCKENKSERIWPKRFPGEDIRTVLTENLARGCTFVLNSHAINLIKLHKPSRTIIHDWWILILIYSSGSVTWTKQPEVRYRIHKDNVIGSKPRFRIRLNRFIKSLRDGDWVVLSQTNELLSVYGWLMSVQKRHEIVSFLRDINSHLLVGRWKVILWNKRYRSNSLDELAVRLRFLVYRRKKKG